MRKLFLFCFCLPLVLSAQTQYEPNDIDPYGQKHPEAPKQFDDFKPMIGTCDCESQNKNPDRSWADPVKMTWTFKYIMNGTAIQDETLKADGKHSGSIRQFHKDSLRWYVHYYSSATPTKVLSVWEGNKNTEGKIVLYKPQKAPNGMDGFSRLTFYDISDKGYKWIGEWVDPTEQVRFPFLENQLYKKRRVIPLGLDIKKETIFSIQNSLFSILLSSVSHSMTFSC